MGGMQVLEWAATYPERVRSAVAIATAPKHSAQNIAFHEVGRQAIMADPKWNGGSYYLNQEPPAAGLAEIGRASCRERVCQYVEISVVAGSIKKKKKKKKI